MSYISLDIQFGVGCFILFAFGVLFGLYHNYNISNAIEKEVLLKVPKRIEQVYWNTHCGICHDSYEDIYLRNNKNVAVPVLIPCYHTCCAICYSRLVQQHGSGQQLECYLCRCKVMFAISVNIKRLSN